MIALIVLGIIAIAMILVGIALIVNDEDGFIGAFAFALILICILVGCLMLGESIEKSNFDYFEEKAQIECLLENHLNYDTIKKAKAYNDNVDFGNNYWCRFNIEDRSEYKIDIDKYIARESEK